MYGTMTPDARGTIDALTEQHPHYWGPVIVSSEEEKEESIRFQVRVTEFPFNPAWSRKAASSRSFCLRTATSICESMSRQAGT